MEEDDQNPNTLRNFSPYKIGRLEKIQTEADFFLQLASICLLLNTGKGLKLAKSAK